MNTATPSGTPAELAKRLITFRHEHWTHWTEAENNLVVECVQALRAPSEGEKAEPVASPVRDALANLISEQAEDDALWFEAEHIAEAYFQQELRRLHAAVESALASPPAPPAQPLRMLTMLELLQAKDNHGTYETEDESIQRKFMEVNGLSLGEAGKDASDGEQR